MIVLLAGADLRDHRGPGPRLGRAADRRVLRRRGGGAGRAARSYESRRAEPLLDPRFFAQRPVLGGDAHRRRARSRRSPGSSSSTRCTCRTSAGYSPLHAGLLHAADGGDDGGAPADLRPDGGRARRAAAAGRSAASASPASGVLLLSLDVDTPLPLLVAAYVVFGLGFGMVNAPITNTAVSGHAAAQAGRRGGGRVDQPPGRLGARRRGARARWSPRGSGASTHGGFRRGRPAGVGGRHRLRARGAGAGPGEHDGAGPGDGAAHGRAVRGRRSPAAALAARCS